jgi:hypothetical protein
MAQVRTDRTAGDGDRAATRQGVGVEPPVSRRRRRLPEMVVGVLLVAGFALAAVVLATSGRDRSPVLALADDVSRGEVINESHLSTVHVGSDSTLAAVAGGDEASVVGRAALTDLSAGTLVTHEQLGEPVEVLDRGAGVVGLSLEAGQLPSLDLAPGDRVSVVAGAALGGEGEAGVVIDGGEVVSFERVGDPDEPGVQLRWWVGIRAPEGSATDAAAVAASGTDVHLVLVSRDGVEAPSPSRGGGF